MSDKTVSGNEKKPNRLIFEKSPYLLQHAYNPVEWYPWGDEAFEKAKKEDKPVFLSIGYSTCHWCHVMEKECFEDDKVASLMNEVFVSIKVDREERPDIDSIYMSSCQKMIGSGGWPLNMILTPDRKPFHAMTYAPKESRYGRVGMLDLIPRIKNIWHTKKVELENTADQIVNALKDSIILSGEGIGEDMLHQAYEQLFEMFDTEHGGFGNAPKFPTSHNLFFLLRYWKRTGDKMALLMVEKTLSSMRRGGIYDHIGSGFHRYSVDPAWRIPHFEKMLYDQALLMMAYTEAYLATDKEEYKKTCGEIFEYIKRDMTSIEGAFFSGEDADSEGEEGKFYLWKKNEINETLSDTENEVIRRVFDIREHGNFQEGNRNNILYMTGKVGDFPGLTITEEEEILGSALGKLFTEREKRIHPGKDDKILTDWNGLMISALAKASQAYDEPDFAGTAQKAADFILSRMRNTQGELYHRYRDGESAILGFLDDYAFLIWGLLDLYETVFDIRYLKEALELNNYLLEHFWDSGQGGFFFTSDKAENILVRKKDIYDGAVPSGNAAAMLNLIRLSKITADPDLEQKAESIARTFSEQVLQAPAAYTMLLTAFDFFLGPSSQVVIAGDLRSEETTKMVKALRKKFVPNKVVLFRPDVESEITNISEYTRNLSGRKGKATAFVCRNFSCHLPVTQISDMLELL